MRIEYEIFGAGKTGVLFQHGWGNGASFWDHLFREHLLNFDGLRCVTTSFRGDGGSDAADRFARDMFAVADAAGLGRFIVVGFSMAGKFCRSMASLDESRILGQVLVAPLGPDPLAIPSDAFAGWLEAAPFSERYRPILDQFIAKPVREDLKELYCANVARASRAALVGTISMQYEPLAKEIGRVRVPTLVIAGKHDPVLTPAYVKEQILDRTPGAPMVTLPCGHEIPIEMPSDMAWLLEAFLAASQNAQRNIGIDASVLRNIVGR